MALNTENLKQFLNFKMPEMTDEKQSKIELFLNQFYGKKRISNVSKACVNLDFLSICFFDENKLIPQPQKLVEEVQLSPKLSLLNGSFGNAYYKNCWCVFYGGLQVANIFCYTRNEKFVPTNVIDIMFMQNIMNTPFLWTLYDELVRLFKLQYKNVHRVDIVIDGYKKNFRNEVCLKSEMTKAMENFDINWLKNSNMLMSIVKHMNKSFFEFV